MEDNVSVSLIEKLESGIKARKRGDTVRFVYDRTMPQDLLDFLLSNNAIEEEDNIVAGGRYHNFKDFIDFPVIGCLLYTSPSPRDGLLSRMPSSA